MSNQFIHKASCSPFYRNNVDRMDEEISFNAALLELGNSISPSATSNWDLSQPTIFNYDNININNANNNSNHNHNHNDSNRTPNVSHSFYYHDNQHINSDCSQLSLTDDNSSRFNSVLNDINASNVSQSNFILNEIDNETDLDLNTIDENATIPPDEDERDYNENNNHTNDDSEIDDEKSYFNNPALKNISLEDLLSTEDLYREYGSSDENNTMSNSNSKSNSHSDLRQIRLQRNLNNNTNVEDTSSNFNDDLISQFIDINELPSESINNTNNNKSNNIETSNSSLFNMTSPLESLSTVDTPQSVSSFQTTPTSITKHAENYSTLKKKLILSPLDPPVKCVKKKTSIKRLSSNSSTNSSNKRHSATTNSPAMKSCSQKSLCKKHMAYTAAVIAVTGPKKGPKKLEVNSSLKAATFATSMAANSKNKKPIRPRSNTLPLQKNLVPNNPTSNSNSNSFTSVSSLKSPATFTYESASLVFDSKPLSIPSPRGKKSINSPMRNKSSACSILSNSTTNSSIFSGGSYNSISTTSTSASRSSSGSQSHNNLNLLGIPSKIPENGSVEYHYPYQRSQSHSQLYSHSQLKPPFQPSNPTTPMVSPITSTVMQFEKMTTDSGSNSNSNSKLSSPTHNNLQMLQTTPLSRKMPTPRTPKSQNGRVIRKKNAEFQNLMTKFSKKDPEEFKPQTYQSIGEGLMEFQVQLDNRVKKS